MANTCFTDYCVCSNDPAQLRDLYLKMKGLEDRSESLVENDYGKTWLGNLVQLLGGSWQDVYCRGEWNNLSLDGELLSFDTETAWCEMDEFRHFVESCYPGMKFYYMSDEPDSNYFITNDATGTFFPDRFHVDVENEDYQTFTSLDDAKRYIEQLMGRTLRDDEDPGTALSDWAEEDQEGHGYGALHEYEIVDD